MAYKVVMTADEMVEKVKHICFDLKTYYKNIWPYNLGYHHSDGRFSWDCWNFYPKTLVWGWDDTIPVGQYQPKNLDTGLGDWNGWTILQCCQEISTDFHRIIPAEFLLTKDKGHAGCYVGEFVKNGKTYNVIECTVSFGGGVVPSWVDSDGTRRSCKGGSVSSAWHWHGKLPWLNYNAQKAPLAVDGAWGMQTTRYTQKFLGTVVDGIVSGQRLANKKYLPAAETSSWKFALFGKGSNMIKALQKFVGAGEDGLFGPASVKQLQLYLKTTGDYSGEIDGYMGKNTVKAWQAFINRQFTE